MPWNLYGVQCEVSGLEVWKKMQWRAEGQT